MDTPGNHHPQPARVGRRTIGLHLFEMLVFSGHENVALHQPVKASSQNVLASDKYNPALLVDGFLPYVMDTAKGAEKPCILSLPPHQISPDT